MFFVDPNPGGADVTVMDVDESRLIYEMSEPTTLYWSFGPFGFWRLGTQTTAPAAAANPPARQASAPVPAAAPASTTPTAARKDLRGNHG